LFSYPLGPRMVFKTTALLANYNCISLDSKALLNINKITDINFQRLSDYENSTTKTSPTSASALFYSAHSHEHLDLFHLSPFAKLQNPPEGKVPELFRSKVGDFPQRTYVATAPIYIGPAQPHQFPVLPSVSTAQPHNCHNSFNKPLPTT